MTNPRFRPLNKPQPNEMFDERQLHAIEILALPNRGGMTYDEVAKAVGISMRQLQRWRKSKDFQQGIIDRAMENIRAELPAVFSANLAGAKKGNTKHIELVYKLLGMMIERQEVHQTVQDNRSNESIESEITKLSKLLEEDDQEEAPVN